MELDRYSGPLDLLLWLIKREEVDIHDIPIALILTRSLEMLQTIQSLDLDQAGEFLVMASVLMEIKTRSLLPREEPFEDEELDPRFELIQKLLEYRRFKEVSEDLRQRSDQWALRFAPGRAPERPGLPPDEVPLADVSVWDLTLAFQQLLAEVEVRRPRAIVYDDVPIEEHMKEVLGIVTGRGRVPFLDLFPPDADRSFVAGVFLAVLELIKQTRVRARQRRPFAPIEIVAQKSKEAGESPA